MKRIWLLIGSLAAAIGLQAPAIAVTDGQLWLRIQGTNTLLQIQGGGNDDWRFQVSIDLVHWSNAPALGTLRSGDETAPAKSIDATLPAKRYFKAVKTEGLYDPLALRTIRLTFTQTNWQTLLANGRTTGSNTACTLVLDNGTTNYGVGARYKGNSSYTGMGSVPTKKSLNLELDFTDDAARLMGYKTINLNNAYNDETILREALYFEVMRRYTVCPKCSLARLYINGVYWGVYSAAQQQDGDMMNEWFPSNDGDRWRAPNIGGDGGGPGGGGGFSGSGSALSYLGGRVASYTNNYELKSDNSTNAWKRLMNACTVLNTTATNLLRNQVDEVLAVDRWLWFLAVENIFTDEDSYYYKGADYMFYYEPESGRIHPVEHDGNESSVLNDVSVSPVEGASGTNRPVLSRLLAIPELRQRYLAHMRTVLEESFHPAQLTPLVNQYAALSLADITADTKKGYTMQAYASDLLALKTFVTNRYKFLTNHAELRPLPPFIIAVSGPTSPLTAYDQPWITAAVLPNGTNGVSSVWLYCRGTSYGRFTAIQMLDDGAHGDGAAGDGLYGAAATNFPSGSKVRYYVEARSANSAKAARFSPPRAEQETCHYHVGLTAATHTPVVINEFMAINSTAEADPQGEYDDWIELRNLTDQAVDLSGCYLSDEPGNPRKWPFPAGATIPEDGYLLVWADNDVQATPGLHASFKLDGTDGEQLYLVDTDAHLNVVLDVVEYGPQEADRSYGRLADRPDVFDFMEPTPLEANK